VCLPIVITVKNNYANRSEFSEAKFRKLLQLFSHNLEATQIAELTGLNRNTVNLFLKAFRIRLAEYCKQLTPFSGNLFLASQRVRV